MTNIITIRSIHFYIEELKIAIMNKTITGTGAINSLNNIQKRIQEYEYMTDKQFKEQNDIKDKEIKKLSDIISKIANRDEEDWYLVDPNKNFYVEFKDALPELIKGRRFRKAFPCGDDFQTLNEFVCCSKDYILEILKGKVDLEPLDPNDMIQIDYERTKHD